MAAAVANDGGRLMARCGIGCPPLNTMHQFAPYGRRFCKVRTASLLDLLKAGQQASQVLNDPRRPVQNVSEWAKKDQCWTGLKRYPSCLDADPVELAVEKPKHASRRRTSTSSSTSTPRHEAISEKQPAADENLIHDWRNLTTESYRRLYDFALGKAFLSPKSETSLTALINGRDDSINVNSLNHLVSLCVKTGFPLSSPLGAVKSLLMNPCLHRPMSMNHRTGNSFCRSRIKKLGHHN